MSEQQAPPPSSSRDILSQLASDDDGDDGNKNSPDDSGDDDDVENNKDNESTTGDAEYDARISDEDAGIEDVESGGRDILDEHNLTDGDDATTSTTNENIDNNEEGLAVAVAINEDDDNEYHKDTSSLPNAVEYDPDAKPPLYKHRKFHFYSITCAILFLVLVIACVIVAFIPTTTKKSTSDINAVEEAKTYSPTEMPTSVPTTTDIGNMITLAKSLITPPGYTIDTIDDYDTYLQHNATETQRIAYEYAIDWILNEDPMKLTLLSPNFEQRFLLAFFYYHVVLEGEKLLGPGEGWLSCGKPDYNSIKDENKKASGDNDKCELAIFNRDRYDRIYYTYSPGNNRWLSGHTECEWAGLFCDENDEISAIDLPGQDFSGPIPRELSSISTLQYISLGHNLFTGTIPSDFALNLKRLINIELHYNLLTGEFPIEYLNSFALQRLNFYNNQLTGSIVHENDPSVSIGNLQALRGLFVGDNELSGPFPSEIGTLEFLSYARFDNNNYDTGIIPTEIGRLTLLKELWLGWSSFTGPIPSEFGMLTDLSDLRFEYNDLTGSLPDELYKLSDLEVLYMDRNRLSGTLSPMVAEWEQLQELLLDDNEFTGYIPSEMGLLKKLVVAKFHFNQFVGPVPDEMCANSAIPGVASGVTGVLEYLNADCLGENPKTPCQKYCCTACCSRETELCYLDRRDEGS